MTTPGSSRALRLHRAHEPPLVEVDAELGAAVAGPARRAPVQARGARRSSAEFAEKLASGSRGYGEAASEHPAGTAGPLGAGVWPTEPASWSATPVAEGSDDCPAPRTSNVSGGNVCSAMVPLAGSGTPSRKSVMSTSGTSNWTETFARRATSVSSARIEKRVVSPLRSRTSSSIGGPVGTTLADGSENPINPNPRCAIDTAGRGEAAGAT